MTEEKKEPKADLEGFDMPEDTVVPPPFVSAVGEPAGIEPHVKSEEARGAKKESVLGKVIALVAIPVIALVAFLILRQQRQQPWLEYQADCKQTATAFLKGMSDDTEDSLPAAYNLLHRDLRAGKDVESVQDDYRAATAGVGRFTSLDEPTWDKAAAEEASKSFRAIARFENGPVGVWFKFARVKTGDTIEVRITEYKLGMK